VLNQSFRKTIELQETHLAHWIRYAHGGRVGIGTLDPAGQIAVHAGDFFDHAQPTGDTLALAAVEILTPTTPRKMIALWNNFHALAAKLGNPAPPEPLYFLKSDNSFLAAGQTIRAPASYRGKVVYEGELGIVIGKTCRAISETDAQNYIFGYTCINDVTAAELINKDPTFAQWTRAKNFDTFGVFGPVIATGLDPLALSVRTILNGQERQSYPVSDMIFPPAKIVSLVSQDMTLEAGDVIACGTSVGVGSMKPGSTVTIAIDGIGELTNRFE
jgi:2-keto-4-pentenoate hydratase/2-oxohepta-3-ene-1,7-dioic acid hydratase in catechol pathway